VKVSTEVEIACSVAATEASNRGHELMTVEHLLYALLLDVETARVVARAGGNVQAIKRDLERVFEEEIPRSHTANGAGPVTSNGFRRVLQRAAIHVESSGKEELKGYNVVIAVFAEDDSFAAKAMEDNGVTRYDLVNFVAHGVAKRGGEELNPEPTEDGEEGATTETDPLKRFAVNLNERASLGQIDPLIGREKEVKRAIQILARRRKNNPLFVGDAGVGKTAIVEGLATKVIAKDVPVQLQDAVFYSLDMGSLLAGTKFRGEFESRMKAVIKALEAQPGSVLFIDEIHTVIGAGAAGGGTVDASNLLKPALSSGKLRCIGATTFEEYRKHMERDSALTRRFQKVDVTEPTVAETTLILRGLKSHYESFHGVTYADEAVEAAAKLADKHLRDRKLPDKAIDLLDEAGADAKLDFGPGSVVDVARIEQVVARMAQIPTRQVSADDKSSLRNLEATLKKVVFGQDNAIAELASAIKLARAGLRPPEKPIGSYLFSGPTGVGKTEVAKQLARVLGIELLRFDMSEYMERHTVSRLIGAPPGYVGHDNGGLLTEAVSKTPHAVLLLDEIEKAHPDIFNVLLQIMDHGTLTDNNGKKADFRHVVLIMTSNVGAHDLARVRVGFGQQSSRGDGELAYKNMFSPEFRNRLDAKITFSALSEEVMQNVVEKAVSELAKLLRDRDVTISLTPAATAHFAKIGYDRDNGARPLNRLIQDKIKRPLGDELLFGALQSGGHVTVDVEGEELKFSFTASETPVSEVADTLH
jgi:ATP-dependent Clp protease ATP-binding subunit ClpA